MQKTIGIFEAKTHLSALIDYVDRFNAEVVITRREKKIARMIPFKKENRKLEVLRKMEQFRKNNYLNLKEGESIKSLIEEGRK